MIRKYHNHTLQTNPRHCEEEPHNIYSNNTSVRNNRKAWRCHQEFQMPCLVNMISKDTQLVFLYSLSHFCLFQAMGLLHQVRNDLSNIAGSPLEQWVKRYGAETIKKYKRLTPENHFVGPISFQLESPEKTFRVFIDKHDRFNQVDKLSQVYHLLCYVALFFLRIYI